MYTYLNQLEKKFPVSSISNNKHFCQVLFLPLRFFGLVRRASRLAKELGTDSILDATHYQGMSGAGNKSLIPKGLTPKKRM